MLNRNDVPNKSEMAILLLNKNNIIKYLLKRIILFNLFVFYNILGCVSSNISFG